MHSNEIKRQRGTNDRILEEMLYNCILKKWAFKYDTKANLSKKNERPEGAKKNANISNWTTKKIVEIYKSAKKKTTISEMSKTIGLTTKITTNKKKVNSQRKKNSWEII